MAASTFDYIIVGAGAAGCVLAYRLTEDPSTKVLLLEFGGPDANPMHYIPKVFFFTLRGDRYLYRYPTRSFKVDGTGETWTRVGLETSEHIGEIVIDPRDTNVVYVAVQGPLWSSGGDRGIFKTTDGGKTWKNVLNISPDTGGNGLAMDPNNPSVLYATTWQRRRSTGQFVGGGFTRGYDVAPDGRFLMRQTVPQSGDLNAVFPPTLRVVLNWHDAVKRLASSN